MAITSKEIAELAGVSRVTVYRVMNELPNVKEEVRERVKKIIKEHNYQPNYAGRALVKNRENIKIGAIGLTRDNSLYDEITRGIIEAAKENERIGVEVLLRFTEDISSVEANIKAINDLVSEGIQGLAIMGIDDERVQEELNCIAKDIPIVTYNSDISNIDRLCFVGQDATKSGSVAGALVCKHSTDSGNVVIVENSLKVAAVAKRVKSFKKRIEQENSNYNIVKVIENHNKNEIGYSEIKKLIDQGQQIDIVYMASGIGSEGVCRALIETGNTDVVFVAHDMLPDTVKHLKSGLIDYTLGQELFKQGYKPIKILTDYLYMGINPEDTNVYTNIEIIIGDMV